MVNVAVFNLKDILKYFLKSIGIIVIIFVLAKSYHLLKQHLYLATLDSTIPAIAYISEHKAEEIRN